MTKQTQATPGPWFAECVGNTGGDSPVDVYDVIAGGYVRVAEGLPAGDALLIAAAPALRDALRNLERYLRETPHHNAVEAAAARAALAKLDN